MKDFEQLPHTADIKIRVYGKTMQELLRHALIGMFQVVRPIIAGCEVKDERVICNDLPVAHEIEVDAPDKDALLVDFLSEALYLSDVHNQAYLDVTIHELTDTRIKATLHGAEVTGFEVVELKAVTYHDLKIEQIDGVWQADIVFDI